MHQSFGPIISMASHWRLKFVMEIEIMCPGVIWSINFNFYGILLRFFNIWSETPAERLLRKWLARRSLMLLRDGILIQLWNTWVDIFAKWIRYMLYIYIISYSWYCRNSTGSCRVHRESAAASKPFLVDLIDVRQLPSRLIQADFAANMNISSYEFQKSMSKKKHMSIHLKATSWYLSTTLHEV